MVALELRRDPGWVGAVGAGPWALIVTRPPMAADVTHACRKDTVQRHARPRKHAGDGRFRSIQIKTPVAGPFELLVLGVELPGAPFCR